MEFKIEKNKIKQSLKRIQSIVHGTRSLALSYTLLETTADNKLSMKATDAEVYWKEVVDCQHASKGEVCVSAKLIFEVVSTLPEGEITAHYQEDQNRLTLVIRKSHFALTCLPKKDFPLFPEKESPNFLEIGAQEFLTLLRETSFAINTGSQGMRFHFNGLLLEIHDGKLRAVATNNHRLSISEIQAPAGSQNFPPSIIPRKAIVALEGLLSEMPKEKVKIGFVLDKDQNRSLNFQIGNVTLVTKLISGTFQSLDATIDKITNKSTPITVNSAVLDEVTKRISKVSNQSHRVVQMEINANVAKIEACSSTNDTAKEEIEIESNAQGKVSLNAQYLLDVTKTLDGTIKLWIPSCQNDPEMSGFPIVVKGDNSCSTHVIMPLRDK